MKTTDISKREQQTKKAYGYHVNETEDFRESWRVFKIMAELVDGFQFLSSLKKEVTVMGSARLSEKSPYYAVARELGQLLGKAGFTVITGGGPGIMEAANRGAFEVGGESVGLNIQLPFEQVINPYVKKSTSFYYFFTRKVMLTSPANAFVMFPGGFGTLDEFFEIVDLMDFGLMTRVPIILVGKKFWQPVLDFLLKYADITGVDVPFIKTWQLVETAAEAFELIKDVSDKPDACAVSPNSFTCKDNIDWKLFRVMAELVEGFEFISNMPEAVTVLGSRMIKTDDHYYQAAHQAGAMIAGKGFSVITGGLTGVAEAANRGAFEIGGQSVGIGMKIGGKLGLNSYLSKSITFSFPFIRKLIVTAPTKAFVIFPGGFGTLHQLFELLTLIQTKKMPACPVVLFDRAFWEDLHIFIKETMVHDLETVSDVDDELYHILDNIDNLDKIISR